MSTKKSACMRIGAVVENVEYEEMTC